MTFTKWHGEMNWLLAADWECEVCGNDGLWAFVGKQRIRVGSGLEWGSIHGVCRCTQCHAKYEMRRDGKRATKPRSLLKPRYKEAARLGWEPLGLPLDEWTDHMWTVALEWAEGAEKGEDYEQQGVSVSV